MLNTVQCKIMILRAFEADSKPVYFIQQTSAVNTKMANKVLPQKQFIIPIGFEVGAKAIFLFIQFIFIGINDTGIGMFIRLLSPHSIRHVQAKYRLGRAMPQIRLWPFPARYCRPSKYGRSQVGTRHGYADLGSRNVRARFSYHHQWTHRPQCTTPSGYRVMRAPIRWPPGEILRARCKPATARK